MAWLAHTGPSPLTTCTYVHTYIHTRVCRYVGAYVLIRRIPSVSVSRFHRYDALRNWKCKHAIIVTSRRYTKNRLFPLPEQTSRFHVKTGIRVFKCKHRSAGKTNAWDQGCQIFLPKREKYTKLP
jgi:hypothetical protein